MTVTAWHWQNLNVMVWIVGAPTGRFRLIADMFSEMHVLDVMQIVVSHILNIEVGDSIVILMMMMIQVLVPVMLVCSGHWQ